MTQGINRRVFSKGAVTAATAASLAPGRVLGANDQVRLGFIGVGNRGCQLLKGFLPHADAKIVALCDVYEPYLHGRYDRLDPRFAGLGKRIAQMPKLEGDVARVSDFRAVLDRKDIDAVVIATPDHWHAIQMIAACKAGKDVYVEKPLSMTVVEGRAMVEAARRYDRVVQVGTHRRSSRMYAELAELVRSGAIGKVTVARASFCSNMATAGIGHAPESEPPAGLDWDQWLGPRPARPFQATIMPYKFRWWHLYSSQIANWGVHYFDAIRWLTGELAPQSVSASRRAVCRRRRSHDPGHGRGDLRARVTNAHAFQPSRSQRSADARPRRRDRAAGDDRHALRGGRSLRDRSGARGRVSGPDSRSERQRSSKRATAISISRPPAIFSTASRAANGRTPTSKRAIARRHSPIWPTSRSRRGCAWSGTRRPSGSPTASRPINCCTTSIASRGAWREPELVS